MISTLTVSGGLSINSLARKDNLVVQLDASPGTYTAYPFNSGSQSGVSSSILTWSNRWTDLSGNNNHAYAVKNMSGGYQVATYSSGGCPLSSSYLANSIFINLFSDANSSGLRLNPITESTGPMSLFVWVRPRVDITGVVSAVVLDKRKQNGDPGGEPTFAQYQMTWNPKTGFTVGIYDNNNSSAVLAFVGPMGGVLSSTTWYNVGFTLSNNTAGSTLTGYLNGAAQYTATLTGDMVYSNKQIIIGRRNLDTSNRAAMDLSQFLIYNVCLTPQEVWNNYQITKYKHQP